MASKGYPSYTNSTISLITGGTYAGDGINGWAGGTTYSFTVKGRRKRLNRPKEDTTDTGYQSGVGGPIGYHVELEGFFKTGTIPPATAQDEFVKVIIIVGFTLTAVLLVTEFEQIGVIGTALSYRLVGDTDGTFTDA